MKKINRYCYTKLVKFVTRQILKIKKRYSFPNFKLKLATQKKFTWRLVV
ncbi:hypothetical protein ERS070161_00080, partial [Streptococcus pneumoniae]